MSVPSFCCFPFPCHFYSFAKNVISSSAAVGVAITSDKFIEIRSVFMQSERNADVGTGHQDNGTNIGTGHSLHRAWVSEAAVDN